MRTTEEQAPPKEELIGELPANALEAVTAAHVFSQASVQDPADLSAAAMGRQDNLMCAKRSYMGETIVVRIIPKALSL